MLPAARDDPRGVETFAGARHDGLRYFDHPGGAGRVLRVADSPSRLLAYPHICLRDIHEGVVRDEATDRLAYVMTGT